MKILIQATITSLLFVMLSCGTKSNQANEESTETMAEVISYSFYGDSIPTNKFMAASEVKQHFTENPSDTVINVKGSIKSCCQKKGCWMTMDVGNDEEMMVRFKDYGFFVPKETGGKEVIIQGKASWDTVSVDELRHYAEDAGKSEEEIMAITEPELSLRFLASGVAIAKSDSLATN